MLHFKKRHRHHGNNVALFVDGPNIIRKEFNIDLDDLRKIAQKYGRLMIGKVFLNQYASEKLIEAISNQGMEPHIIMAGESSGDVDVAVAVAAVKAAYNDSIHTVVLASRDADYLPAVQLVKERGKKIVIIGTLSGFSKALQNVADFVEILPRKK